MLEKNARISARAIVILDGALLLNRFGDGLYYNFPGGGIEPLENASQAVVREMKEETGLDVVAGEMVFALECEPVSSGRPGEPYTASFFLRCEVVGKKVPSAPAIPDISPDDPTLVPQAVWVPLSELPSIKLLPAVAEPLLRWHENGVFTPLLWDVALHPDP